MPTGPTARILDTVLHKVPGVLTPSPGALNVHIGGRPAWRGLPAGAGAALLTAKIASTATIAASAATPAFEGVKAAEATRMSALITSSAGGSDIHVCVSPIPIPIPPPCGPGVVIDGSQTVSINGLSACRIGDTVLEAFGPPDFITSAEFTVITGG